MAQIAEAPDLAGGGACFLNLLGCYFASAMLMLMMLMLMLMLKSKTTRMIGVEYLNAQIGLVLHVQNT